METFITLDNGVQFVVESVEVTDEQRLETTSKINSYSYIVAIPN
jgi:hypothetical protein